jgi:hypothetical protein
LGAAGEGGVATERCAPSALFALEVSTASIGDVLVVPNAPL